MEKRHSTKQQHLASYSPSARSFAGSAIAMTSKNTVKKPAFIQQEYLVTNPASQQSTIEPKYSARSGGRPGTCKVKSKKGMQVMK